MSGQLGGQDGAGPVRPQSLLADRIAPPIAPPIAEVITLPVRADDTQDAS